MPLDFSKIKPTKAEALLLERRRLNLTQHTRAEELDVSPREYIAWELGKTEMNYSPVLNGELTIPEQLFLLRRRRNLSQKTVASEIGCCRFWMNKMERGLAPHTQLENFWKEKLRNEAK